MHTWLSLAARARVPRPWRQRRRRGPSHQHLQELPARADPKLAEHVVQMPLDGARAEEEPRPDLRIRQALTSQARDLSLLRGQVVARLDRTLAHLLASRVKLSACAIGE